MTQVRLNAVMILHVHKGKTENISLLDVANSFVNNEHRKGIFGVFST